MYKYFQTANLTTLGYDKVISSFSFDVNKNPYFNTQIITKKVIEMAKQHFMCNNLTGVPVELTGTSSAAYSHWEENFLGSENMTSQ